MKKQYAAAILAAVMTVGNIVPSFAGQWQWQDVNGDGISECYYYDDNGIMLTNTTTPQTQTSGTASNTVNHNAGYDPAHPLAGKIDEWNLRLPMTSLTGFYVCNNNVQAMLTGQMDQYYAAPVGQSVNPTTGTTVYTEQADYDAARNNEQVLYNWFCNWLNGMDFENMSEMDKAKEIQKVLAAAEYDSTDSISRNSDYAILINKKGMCGDFAMAACSLAKAMGLKCAISGSGMHMVYYIQVNGTNYMGSNQVLNLDFPTPDYVYFQ